MISAPPADAQQFDLRVAIPPTFRVDATAGRLAGLAIITGEREALGHGIYLDRRTVEMAAETVAAAGGRLRGAITHGSLMDFLRRGNDRVLEIPGYFENVRLEDLVLTGDFVFYDTFREQQPDIFARLMEMAAKTPELFGLSAEPYGYAVFVDRDGREYTAIRDPDTGDLVGAPDGTELQHDGMPVFRVTRLRVAAFVDEPAANDGLFARFARRFGLDRMFAGAPPASGPPPVAVLRSIAESFLSWSATQPSLVASPGAVKGIPATDTVTTTTAGFVTAAICETPPPAAPPDEMRILSDLTTAFGAGSPHLARALTLLAADPLLTVDAIRLALVGEDNAALAGQITGGVARIADLEKQLAAAAGQLAAAKTDHAAQLAALSAERDTARRQYDEIRASGAPAPLPIGVPTAGLAGADELEALREQMARETDPRRRGELAARARRLAAASSN
jgi:hypothetical protein